MSSENLNSMLSNLNFVSDDKNNSVHENNDEDYEDDVISIGCEQDIVFEYDEDTDTNDSAYCRTKRITCTDEEKKNERNSMDDVFKNQNIIIDLNYGYKINKKVSDGDVRIADDSSIDECGPHGIAAAVNTKCRYGKETVDNNNYKDDCDKDGDIDNRVYCNPIILDIQMIYHTDDKCIYIKELAFKNLNDNSVYSYEFRHKTDLLHHRIIKYNNDNNIYDIFTGLDISNGDVMYSDNAIIEILKNFDLILLKGGNKKRILEELYTRCKIIDRVPLIINVDGNTACDNDRVFCKTHNVTLASFSFPFVYRHFQIYLNMLCNNTEPSFVYNINGGTFNDYNTIYVHNILSKDRNINIFGRGRVVCVCKNDHSYGSNAHEFGNERCALLNMNILENLWYRGMNKSFRKHIDDFNKLKYLSENLAYKRFDHVNKIVNRHNLNNHNNMYKNNNKYFHYDTFNGHCVPRTETRGYERMLYS